MTCDAGIVIGLAALLFVIPGTVAKTFTAVPSRSAGTSAKTTSPLPSIAAVRRTPECRRAPDKTDACIRFIRAVELLDAPSSWSACVPPNNQMRLMLRNRTPSLQSDRAACACRSAGGIAHCCRERCTGAVRHRAPCPDADVVRHGDDTGVRFAGEGWSNIHGHHRRSVPERPTASAAISCGRSADRPVDGVVCNGRRPLPRRMAP